MKQSLFLLTALATLAWSGCRKIESDGEIQVVIVNGGGSGSGTTGQTITLQGRIGAAAQGIGRHICAARASGV